MCVCVCQQQLEHTEAAPEEEESMQEDLKPCDTDDVKSQQPAAVTTAASPPSSPPPPTTATETVVKSEPKTESQSNVIAGMKLATPIIDMVSNPLAYLEALSQKAKLASATATAPVSSTQVTTVVKSESTVAKPELSDSDVTKTEAASEQSAETKSW